MIQGNVAGQAQAQTYAEEAAAADGHQGLDDLIPAVEQLFDNGTPCDGTLLTNARHTQALTRARESMLRVEESILWGGTPDAVLLDLEDAMESIAEVTGRTMREDITNGIFSRFCVGK